MKIQLHRLLKMRLFHRSCSPNQTVESKRPQAMFISTLRGFAAAVAPDEKYALRKQEDKYGSSKIQ